MKSAGANRLVVVLLLLFAVALAVGTRGSGPRPRPGASPTEEVSNAIYDGLVAAMRQGQVRLYLASFGDPLRAELAAAATDRRALAAQLREFSSRVTGVAVSKVEVLDGEAAARVEWVYRDDADVQQLRLRKQGGRWLVVGLEPLRRAKLPVPYGTEVIPGLKDAPPDPAPATPEK
ncbi:MAG: hypothetical protein IT204_17635 [Fimbriimonadaceae bacterium]|nr:hypothetical protein [Fimbriimonadaceae bacterium]